MSHIAKMSKEEPAAEATAPAKEPAADAAAPANASANATESTEAKPAKKLTKEELDAKVEAAAIEAWVKKELEDKEARKKFDAFRDEIQANMTKEN